MRGGRPMTGGERDIQRLKEYKKKQKERARPKTPPPAPKIEAAQTEDSPSDAPFYDMTPFTAGVALNQELTRDMSFPGFFHCMNNILQTAVADAVFDDGQRPIPGQDSRAQDILPPEYVVPGPIYEYCSNISTISTPGSHEIKVNLPDIMIPQPSYIDDDDVEIPAGTFGAPNAETHNVYEQQVCPYTTMRYVQIAAQPGPPPDQLENWPLPNALMPQRGTTTRDFLGYLPIPAPHQEGKEALRVGIFEEGDNIAGRIRYNAALFTKVNTELMRLEDKFKFLKLGLDKSSRFPRGSGCVVPPKIPLRKLHYNRLYTKITIFKQAYFLVKTWLNNEEYRLSYGKNHFDIYLLMYVLSIYYKKLIYHLGIMVKLARLRDFHRRKELRHKKNIGEAKKTMEIFIEKRAEKAKKIFLNILDKKHAINKKSLDLEGKIFLYI
ncbi:hypothetical protein J6590_097457 [Homalodisca vitripennis]|nr:hypothetical protein J6590_097457 [Homalodisca vitripennis]